MPRGCGRAPRLQPLHLQRGFWIETGCVGHKICVGLVQIQASREGGLWPSRCHPRVARGKGPFRPHPSLSPRGH